MKTYTTTVEEDPTNPDEVIISFPDEMMAELGWKEGDTISWRIEADGTAVISKVDKNGKIDG
jgi:antitoxin component of MazEF toxin-antitoxin module